MPSKRACGLCGADPATGHASINDVWYCHGDDDATPTCYERSQWQYIPDPVKWTIIEMTTVGKDVSTDIVGYDIFAKKTVTFSFPTGYFWNPHG